MLNNSRIKTDTENVVT